MKRKHTLFPILILLLISLSPPLFAQTHDLGHDHSGHDPGQIDDLTSKEQIKKHIEVLLSHYHELPSKESIDSVAGGREALEEFAKDHNSVRQQHAILSLAYYPDQRSFALLKALLQDPKSSETTYHQVLTVIGKHFFKGEGITILQQALNNKDMQIRLTAVYAIAPHDTDTSFNMLVERRKIETDPVIIETIDRLGSRFL